MLILTTDLNYNMYSYFTFGLRYLKSLFQVKKLTSYQVLSMEASLKHEIFVAMRQMFAVRVLGNFFRGLGFVCPLDFKAVLTIPVSRN